MEAEIEPAPIVDITLRRRPTCQSRYEDFHYKDVPRVVGAWAMDWAGFLGFSNVPSLRVVYVHMSAFQMVSKCTARKRNSEWKKLECSRSCADLIKFMPKIVE